MSRRHPRKQSVYQKIIKSKTFYWIDIYGTPLLIILIPLFFVFKSYDIDQCDLMNIDVTISEKPEEVRKKVKYTTYESYVIKTINFKRDFKISGFTYDSTNGDILEDIKPSDKVTLTILKEQYKELKDKTYWNNYNDVLGLMKNGKQYVNLDLRTKLKSKDMRFLLIISLIGLIMLIYSFIKKPIVKMKTMIYISCSILAVILYLYN